MSEKKPRIPAVPFQKVLGQLVLHMRSMEQMEQQVLAENIGMSKANLSRIENGHGNLTVEQLIIICDKLDYRPSDFIRTVEYVLATFREDGIEVEMTKTEIVSSGKTYVQIGKEAIQEIIREVGFTITGSGYRKMLFRWHNQQEAVNYAAAHPDEEVGLETIFHKHVKKPE